jgi:hypothetical protein
MTRANQVTTFRVIDGIVAEGRDALLHYCELADGCGGVYRDLLRTSEMPDGWFAFTRQTVSPAGRLPLTTNFLGHLRNSVLHIGTSTRAPPCAAPVRAPGREPRHDRDQDQAGIAEEHLRRRR